MLKMLIVGESGTPPWAGGCAKKLCEWFDVESIEALQARYMLTNVYPTKDTKLFDISHFNEVMSMVRVADLVFLVGKEAQKELYGRVALAYWLRDKYVGLPHPSGRNRQLNDEDIERAVKCFIKGVIGLFECAPDRPCDWPKGANDAG